MKEKYVANKILSLQNHRALKRYKEYQSCNRSVETPCVISIQLFFMVLLDTVLLDTVMMFVVVWCLAGVCFVCCV